MMVNPSLQEDGITSWGDQTIKRSVCVEDGIHNLLINIRFALPEEV